MNLQSFSNSSVQENFKYPLVLAVDDNEDNLQLLTQLLVLFECSFITANNGESAIVQAKNYQPNLILLDMMLPDVSGLEVAAILKQDSQTQEIPIIAVTAMARTEDKERFLSVGCVDCITKPYIIEQLEAVIRQYIA